MKPIKVPSPEKQHEVPRGPATIESSVRRRKHRHKVTVPRTTWGPLRALDECASTEAA